MICLRVPRRRRTRLAQTRRWAGTPAREAGSGEIEGAPPTTQVPPLPGAWVEARQRGRRRGEVRGRRPEVRPRRRREIPRRGSSEIAQTWVPLQGPSIRGQAASPLWAPISSSVKQAESVHRAGLSEI